MKRLLLFLTMALTLFGVSQAETYTLELTAASLGFTSGSYADNNGDHIVNATATGANPMSVSITSNQVYKENKANSTNMQWQKTNSYLQNKTDLGDIKSIVITSSAGSYKVYEGTSEGPSNEVTGTNGTYNFSSGNGFFKIKEGGSATGYVSKIVVTYEINDGGTTDPGTDPNPGGDSETEEIIETITPDNFSTLDAKYDHYYYTSNLTGITYDAYAYKGNNPTSIQLKSKDDISGIVTTKNPNGYKVKSIELVQNNSGQIDIYSHTTAYKDPSSLYSTSSAGTNIGSITLSSGSLTFDTPTEYWGLKSNNGARYITSLKITYIKDDSTSGPGEEPKLKDYYAPFANQEYSISVGESLRLEVVDPHPEEIIFTISDPSLLIEREGYTFDGKATGTTEVVATWKKDKNFNEGETSFKVTIKEALSEETQEEVVDWSKVLGYGDEDDHTITKNDVTYSWHGTITTQMRVYKNQKLTISVPQGYQLVSIVFTTSGTNYDVTGKPSSGTLKDNEWKADLENPTNSVTFDSSGNQFRISNSVVTYRKIDGDNDKTQDYTALSKYECEGITFAQNEKVQLELGDSHPDISYSYTLENIIAIDDNGIITATGTGEVKVTASWSADNEWNEGSANFTVTVTEPAALPEGAVYKLVTSTDELFDGAQILFVNITNSKAMSSSSSNGNNRTTVDVEITDNTIVNPSQDVVVISLGEEGDNKFSFKVSDGYLEAGSSSSNYLNTKNSLSNNGKATITISESGDATIKFSGSYTRNLVQYNKGSDLFACYSSASQSPVQIFIKQDNDSRETPTLEFPETEYDVDINVEDFKEPVLKLDPSDLKVTYTSSNENAATVDSETGEVTLVAVGKTTITASFDGDETYEPADDYYDLMIHPVDILSVAEALAAIANGYEGTAQVKGVVTKVEEVREDGKLSYYIKDEGSKDEILVYEGLWRDKNEFEGQNEIMVGDNVTVEGTLVNYDNKTPEITESYVKEHNGEKFLVLSFPEKSYTINQNADFSLPELTIKVNDDSDLDEDGKAMVKDLIRYSVTGTEGLAKVENNNVSFDTSILGSATITASIADNDRFEAEEVEFTLTVIDPNHLITEITWNSFGLDKANGSYADYTLYFPNKETAEITYEVNVALPAGTMQFAKNTSSSGKHSGLVVSKNTTYRVKSVKVDWNEESDLTGTEFSIYTSKDAYTHPDNLFQNERAVPGLTKTNTEINDFDDNYPYIGLRAKDNALKIDKITIVWETLPMMFEVNEYAWDAEWKADGNTFEIAIMHENDDWSELVTEEEIVFSVNPVFEASEGSADKTTDGDYTPVKNIVWNEGTLAITFPCSGLYEIVATPQAGYAINGWEKATVIGTANIYPSMEGFYLSYETNEDNDDIIGTWEDGKIKKFPFKDGNITYQFEEDPTSHKIYDNTKTPFVNVSGGNVEVWYKLHGLGNTTPSNAKARRVASDPQNQGFSKVGEDGKIDLSGLADSDSDSPRMSVILTKNGASTPVQENLAPDDDEVYSTVLININKGGNYTVAVESIFGDTEGEAEFYTLDGLKVNAENLQNGLYIVKKGQKAVKVLIKN